MSRGVAEPARWDEHLGPEDRDVDGRAGAQHGEDGVEGMELGPRPLLARRVEEEDEAEGEGEVDRPLDHRVEDAEDRRVDLEEGEGDGDGGDRPCR